MRLPNSDGAPAGSTEGEAPLDLQPASIFCREGEYWTIAYEGTVFRLRDARGLHCVAYLLRRPGEKIAAMDLLAVGNGFDPRTLSTDPEHARMTVTKRIRGAVKKIEAYSASLGHHLGTCIKTGSWCAYIPDPHHPLPWRL